mmetsp:Transcript_14373/g.40887  ORF Transcript_14373/g.40887 Transcript_14373/m.40887 type:complete len:339 (+) Transcript_14373:54-1070(+)
MGWVGLGMLWVWYNKRLSGRGGIQHVRDVLQRTLALLDGDVSSFRFPAQVEEALEFHQGFYQKGLDVDDAHGGVLGLRALAAPLPLPGVSEAAILCGGSIGQEVPLVPGGVPYGVKRPAVALDDVLRVSGRRLPKVRQSLRERKEVALGAEDVLVGQIAHHPVGLPDVPRPRVEQEVKVLEGLGQEERFHVVPLPALVHAGEGSVAAPRLVRPAPRLDRREHVPAHGEVRRIPRGEVQVVGGLDELGTQGVGQLSHLRPHSGERIPLRRGPVPLPDGKHRSVSLDRLVKVVALHVRSILAPVGLVNQVALRDLGPLPRQDPELPGDALVVQHLREFRL